MQTETESWSEQVHEAGLLRAAEAHEWQWEPADLEAGEGAVGYAACGGGWHAAVVQFPLDDEPGAYGYDGAVSLGEKTVRMPEWLARRLWHRAHRVLATG